jgi:hypothetical protein
VLLRDHQGPLLSYHIGLSTWQKLPATRDPRAAAESRECARTPASCAAGLPRCGPRPQAVNWAIEGDQNRIKGFPL